MVMLMMQYLNFDLNIIIQGCLAAETLTVRD